MNIPDPIITFGREHRGKTVSMLSHDFLLWIAFPEKRSFRTKRYQVPNTILKAAKHRIQTENVTIPDTLPTRKERGVESS